MNLAGYLLALSIALSGAAVSRLQHSGELSGKSGGMSLAIIVLGLVYAATGLAGIFYFSWAHLKWPHWLFFLFASVFLTKGVARATSKAVVWAIFVVSLGIAALSEALLVLG